MLKFDPHIHSSYSYDCNSEISDILKTARVKKLDVIAISDHDTVEGSKIAIKESKKYDDLLVIPSMEVSSSKGHILALGVEEIIEKNLSPVDTIEKIHENGGLAIIPHPFNFYRSGLFSKTNPNLLNFDAIEVLNAKFFVGYTNNKAKKYAIQHKIPPMGASDSHILDTIGACYSEVNCNFDIESILKAIKKNNVNAKGKGNSYFRNRFKRI